MEYLTIQQIQEVELNLLKEFSDFCEKHQLTYYLDSGTLLGAIRNGRFIPWDDDTDIMMPYPDYLKFIKLYQAEKHENRTLSYNMVGRAAIPYAKLQDTRYPVSMPGRDEKHSVCVWLDIFPLFALSDDDREAQEQIDTIHKSTLLSWRFLRRREGKPTLRKFAANLLQDLILSYSVHCSLKAANRYPYGSTKRVRIVCGISNHFNGFSMDAVSKAEIRSFDGLDFKVPAGYDEVLTAYYGKDYLTPPPEDKRSNHCIQVFQR